MAPIPNPRGATLDILKSAFEKADVENVVFHASISDAYDDGLRQAASGDRIVIFGSFHTVAAVFLR